jgi:hypothetical protein
VAYVKQLKAVSNVQQQNSPDVNHRHQVAIEKESHLVNSVKRATSENSSDKKQREVCYAPVAANYASMNV